MKIVVISDIHAAKIWDKVEKILPREANFLNPNKSFRSILRRISENKPDLLVINGDSVDYHYSSYLEKKENNWKVFLDILEQYKGETMLNYGNHDYRSMPYNFSIQKLKHVNVSCGIRKKNGHAIGFNKFRLWKEFDSVFVNLKKFNPINSVRCHRKKSKTLSNSRILLLNTGPDAINSLSQLVNPLNWPSFFWRKDSSLGPTKKDFLRLKKELNRDRKELLIFMHCPPFLSKNKISKIKLNRIFYKLTLIKNKLIHDFFTRNNWKFISLLLNSNKNITVISSHSHIPKQYMINKKTKVLTEATIDQINQLRKDLGYIKFVTTLPIGSLMYNYKEVGYLEISSDKIEHKVVKNYN